MSNIIEKRSCKCLDREYDITGRFPELTGLYRDKNRGWTQNCAQPLLSVTTTRQKAKRESK